jgi:uncharacterized protein (UPF0305 family)
MKLSHNKKRNTAFLYEVLISELTKNSLNNNKKSQEAVVKVLKEFFSKGKTLAQELSLYKELESLESYGKDIISKIISEAVTKRAKLNDREIFNEQTRLISKINKSIGKDSLESFVPNYKSLATIYQIFNDKTPIRTRVILENNLVKSIMNRGQLVVKENKEKPDKVVYRIFTNKFNKKYAELNESQRSLLKLYIESVRDGGLELKSFINEELSDIKAAIKAYTSSENSGGLNESLEKVTTEIESFKNQYINEDIIKKILKMQALTEEIKNG